MRKFIQNKLWRDKSPDWIRSKGSVVHVKELSDADYDQTLRDKLTEEAEEVVQTQTKQEMIEEIADVLEVIDALCKHHNISLDEVQHIKQQKLKTRGGLYNRQYVSFAEHPKGSMAEEYCLSQPDKYIEVK